VCIAHTKVEHLIEATRAEQRCIQQIGTIRRADDEYATAAIIAIAHSIQLCEQLGHDTIHDTSTITLVTTLRRDGVELIEEDNAGPRVARPLEHTAHVRLRLSNVHVEQLWALDGEEVERELSRDGLCQQRLTRTGWTIEQDTRALLHALSEQLRALERQLDGLHDSILDVRETTDIVPRDVGDLRRTDSVGEVLTRVLNSVVEIGAGEAARWATR
jgi:hypothetical protein